jgi:hypothetical protein
MYNIMFVNEPWGNDASDGVPSARWYWFGQSAWVKWVARGLRMTDDASAVEKSGPVYWYTADGEAGADENG